MPLARQCEIMPCRIGLRGGCSWRSGEENPDIDESFTQEAKMKP